MPSKIDIQADKDLIAKTKLEKLFIKQIKSLFNSMVIDFKATYFATGRQPNSDKYNKQWEVLLDSQYRKAQIRFTKNVTLEKKQIDIVSEDDNSEIEAALLLLLLLWRDENSKKVSEQIGATTARQMSEAIQEAKDLLSEQGLPTDNKSVALTAAKVLRGKFKGRVQNIAVSETQGAVESTKQFVTESIVEAKKKELIIPVVIVSIKTWVTVGDNKVRDTHMAANGQIRPLTQPYLVGGSLLRFPRDRDLGAPAKETNNCRCSSVLSVSGAIVNFH